MKTKWQTTPALEGIRSFIRSLLVLRLIRRFTFFFEFQAWSAMRSPFPYKGKIRHITGRGEKASQPPSLSSLSNQLSVN